jgi:hypothetical protein
MAAIPALAFALSAHAAELDPKAVVYTLPDNIKWVVNEKAGNAQAVIAGDPAKPGLYVVLTKWLAGHHFSRPHWHPNDRFITVIKGTWWVGSGGTFDPDHSTVPLPAGTVVTHYGKQVHYDGAKDEDAVLMIVGEGPATSTPFVAATEMKK